MKTKKFIFYGEVQGVGFRYRAFLFANKLNITGWVKNNEDKTVTLVAQGEEKNIEALINYLKLIFKGNIKKIEESEIEEPQKYENFVIEK